MFMNDADAGSQALAARCLQVLRHIEVAGRHTDMNTMEHDSSVQHFRRGWEMCLSSGACQHFCILNQQVQLQTTHSHVFVCMPGSAACYG
jgi:hypothetical protein